ncbi:MAG TPA: AEC family transporter [Clostridia bacterium]|nr:AEC family transporter [Clostridia bacterium]
MVFLHAVGSILTVVLMFMTGYFMTAAGWLDDRTSDTFSRIILNVSLPCYMLYNIVSNFDRARLEQLSGGLIVPVLSIGITYLIGVAASNLLHVGEGRKGIFRSVFFTSNTIFIGLTVNLSLFGEKSTPYVLLYYIVNTTFFWTIGNYEISRDGPGAHSQAFFSRSTLKKIVSPALGGFLVALILVLIGIKLPSFILDACRDIGGMTTPLAMLFIGIVLRSVKLRELKLDREILVLVAARFLICPLTVIALEHFIKLPPLMAKVFVIQSAMPAMTSTGVVAKGYGADYEFGTVVTVITTIMGMIAIPIYMCVI